MTTIRICHKVIALAALQRLKVIDETSGNKYFELVTLVERKEWVAITANAECTIKEFIWLSGYFAAW